MGRGDEFLEFGFVGVFQGEVPTGFKNGSGVLLLFAIGVLGYFFDLRGVQSFLNHVYFSEMNFKYFFEIFLNSGLF